MRRTNRARLIVALAAALSLFYPAGAARSHPKPSLSGTYAFSVVGTALVEPTGSNTPTLVPAAIFGSLAFRPDGTFSGGANVNLGSASCFLSGPGFSTGISGEYAVATGPIGANVAADASITTSVQGGAAPPCVQLNFAGPRVTGPPVLAGIVLAADSSSQAVDVSFLNGSGTIQPSATAQQETVLSLTANGRAILVKNVFANFPGGGSP